MHALQEEAPATDERPLAATPAAVFDAVDPRFRGERFGNAVHHALEHVDFQAWQDHTDAAHPAGEREVLVRALESQDYPADSIADGVRELTRLVAATLNAPLPEGGRLCDLSPSARVAEIEFHFVLADAVRMQEREERGAVGIGEDEVELDLRHARGRRQVAEATAFG